MRTFENLEVRGALIVLISATKQGREISTRGGPLAVISGGITTISRVITYNLSYLFIRPFKGVISLLATSRGPACIDINRFLTCMVCSLSLSE